MELKETINELRKNEKKKFEQTVDLIVNLKGIDLKRDNIALLISIPHSFKEKKICGLLTKRTDAIDSLTELEFQKYKDKKDVRKFVNKYDFFIVHASLMPKVAASFGKVLGPAGKMPSPQLGIINDESSSNIKNQIERINKSIKIRVKEASIKIPIAKENMTDEQIIENIRSAYNSIVAALPNKIDSVRNSMVKLTMSKAIKTEIK